MIYGSRTGQEKVKTLARVLVLLEVQVNSTWGEDCTVKQVHKQARDDSLLQIENLIKREYRINIIGEQKVEAVIVSDDKG